MHRGGAREGTGGAMPGAGRKSNPVPTARHVIRVTTEQWEKFVALGGSPWLQGQLNLKIKARLAASEKSGAKNG